MAALMGHGLIAASRGSWGFLAASVTGTARRDFTRGKKTRKLVVKQSLGATREALAAKGFLRPNKAYAPSLDVNNRLDTICKTLGIPLANESRFDDPVTRFKLLVACSKEFNHYVPNSLLHAIETVGELRDFYQTPVDTTVPIDKMSDIDLPKNLHIQYEYHRFHPETDTMFGGKSAFPKSSTLVTGLKYKGKYQGHIAKTKWP